MRIPPVLNGICIGGLLILGSLWLSSVKGTTRVQLRDNSLVVAITRRTAPPILTEYHSRDAMQELSKSIRDLSETHHLCSNILFKISTRIYARGSNPGTAISSQAVYYGAVDGTEQWYSESIFETPVYALVVLIALFPVLSVVLALKARATSSRVRLCTNCGYDLSGMVDNRCSECGMIVIRSSHSKL